MAIKKKKRGKLLGKFIMLLILASAGGLVFLTMKDTAPPQKAVVKVIQNPNLQ